MKIRFLFHKGKDGWIGKSIVAWTWILAFVSFRWKRLKYNYSHVEIWFPDVDGIFIFNNIGAHLIGSQYAGQCFSSTTRGNAKGVRFAPASEVLHHPERWDYIECGVNKEFVDSLIQHQLEPVCGTKYDYWGIFGFIQPFDTQDSKKWFCSEICAYAAWYLCLFDFQYKRISPRRLARRLAEKYGELKSLA